jgi:3-deoxy-D-manno-octulosonate 8-phosphate phosphatase (KDO 8-P phosphatase)
LTRNNSLESAQKVKWILLDVDGVLTDGGIIFGTDHFEMKRFNARDGHGITLARRAGLKVAIITGRVSEVVQRRAKELSIDALYEGEYNKLIMYDKMKAEFGFEDGEIAYIGDDLQDATLLAKAAFAGTVADGCEELDAVVHMRTKLKGGEGAVREFIDYILKSQGKFEALLKDFGL